MVESILLAAFAVLALVAGVGVVVARHPMHAALALVVAMLTLAGVYGLLGVHAVAIFQVLIYVGAVMVFMVYVIMLLDPSDRSYAERFSRWLAPALAVVALLVAALAYSVWRASAPLEAPAGTFALQPFAAAFLGEFWLHFELVSVLLVAATVAAVAVLGERKGRHG